MDTTILTTLKPVDQMYKAAVPAVAGVADVAVLAGWPGRCFRSQSSATHRCASATP